MSLTKITNRVIEPGTITANSLAAGISLGGGGVTIDQIIVTDENFANTENTQIPVSGGYLKLYGTGFQANANVYLSATFGLDTQVTANVVSENEIRLTTGITSVTTYNLFLFNIDGSTATRLSAVNVIFPPSNAAWFGGGYSPFLSTIQRVLFSTDTGTSSIRGPLTQGRNGTASFNYQDYGYWVSGSLSGSHNTNVDRLIFSSDTTTTTVRTNSLSVKFPTATSNDEYGWISGGQLYPGSRITTINRITFSADTSVLSTRGPMNAVRYAHGSFGNNLFGWFISGDSGGPSVSSVERIQYSNDTVTASYRGNLSSGLKFGSFMQNQIYGWMTQGINYNLPFSPYGANILQRITFDNDTVGSSTRTSTESFFNRGSASSNEYGWMVTGQSVTDSSTTSRINRLTFSDETYGARGNMAVSATSGIRGTDGYV